MTAETKSAQLLLCIPADLKEQIEATVHAEGVSVSVWAEWG